MLITKNTLLKILILGSLIALVTCGGGGGSTPPSAKEIKEGIITGVAALGPIIDGNVTVYDFSSGTKGAALQTATSVTDVHGTFVVPLKSKSKPILVCIEGGSYDEAASTTVPKKRVTFLIKENLCAVTNYQTGKAQNIAITYYTNIAYALALNSIKSSISPATAVTNANNDISDWIGVNIITTLPVDVADSLSDTGTLTDQHKYGFANAAVSSLMSAISTMGGSAQFGNANSKILTQRAFDDVEADGLLNGRIDIQGTAGGLQIGGQALEKAIYRDQLAENITLFSGTPLNKSLLTVNNSSLTQYVSLFAAYSKSVFGIAPPSNIPPIANDDTVQVNVGSAKILEVLKNDKKGNPTDTLTVKLDTDPINGGVLKLNPGNETITYNNPGAIAGDTDSFTYFASDQYVKSTKPATVNISIVAGINTPPVAKSISVNVVAGITKKIVLSDFATDVDGNPLTIIIDTQPASNANPGGSKVIVNKTDNSIEFTAGNSITGQETFTYHVNDGLVDSNVATITVTVITAANTPPEGFPDSVEIRIRGTYIDIPVLDNDKDAQTATIDLSIKANSVTIPAQGKAEIVGRFIRYSLDPLVVTKGVVTFSYIVTDGVLDSRPTTVSVTIYNLPPLIINTAPVISAYIGGSSVPIYISVVDDGPPQFLSVTATNPSLGTVSNTTPAGMLNGFEITYSPPKTSNLFTDTFQVTVFDGFDTSVPVTVRVDLLVINSNPIIDLTTPTSINSFPLVWYKPLNGKVTLPILANITSNGLGLKSISHQIGLTSQLTLIPTQYQPVNSPLSHYLSFDYVFNQLPDGKYDYRIIATDTGGLTGGALAQFGIDSKAPELTISASGQIGLVPTATPPITYNDGSAMVFAMERAYVTGGPFDASGLKLVTVNHKVQTLTSKGSFSDFFPISFPGPGIPPTNTTYFINATYITSYDLTAECLPSRALLAGETLHYKEVPDNATNVIGGVNYTAPFKQCYIQSVVGGSLRYNILPDSNTGTAAKKDGMPKYSWKFSIQNPWINVTSVIKTIGYRPPPPPAQLVIAYAEDVVGHFSDAALCVTAKFVNAADTKIGNYSVGKIPASTSSYLYSYLDSLLIRSSVKPMPITGGLIANPYNGSTNGVCGSASKAFPVPTINGAPVTIQCDYQSAEIRLPGSNFPGIYAQEDLEPNSDSGILNSWKIVYTTTAPAVGGSCL